MQTRLNDIYFEHFIVQISLTSLSVGLPLKNTVLSLFFGGLNCEDDNKTTNKSVSKKTFRQSRSKILTFGVNQGNLGHNLEGSYSFEFFKFHDFA